jgi:serine/threonine-protein kinase
MPKYRPVRALARGGMAEVILATEIERDGSERQVVIKRVLPHLADADELLQLFADEARLASLLVHPNIVRVSATGTQDGRPYLVMEHLDGADLRQLLDAAAARGERLPAAVACGIALGVARGLAYAHELCDDSGVALEIVHRDVSPRNVFVTRGGGVKLLDFGIARARGRMARTRTGLARGKVGYMAPEQLNGLAVDQRTDLFSLGVVLWEMLTGRDLWQRETDTAAARAVRHESARPPSAFVAGLPADVDPLVMGLLGKFPASRPRAARQVEEPLANVLARLGALPPEPAIAACVAELV